LVAEQLLHRSQVDEPEQRRVSLTPSPVMAATTSPRTCSAWGDAELLLGATRASTDTPLPIKSARASSPAGIGPIFLHEVDRAVDDHHRDDRQPSCGIWPTQASAAATQSSAKK
jgi:hypothetical protein